MGPREHQAGHAQPTPIAALYQTHSQSRRQPAHALVKGSAGPAVAARVVKVAHRIAIPRSIGLRASLTREDKDALPSPRLLFPFVGPSLSLHPHPRSTSSSSSISPFSKTRLLLLFVYATALNQSNLLELKKRKSKYTLDLGYCGLVERGPGFLKTPASRQTCSALFFFGSPKEQHLKRLWSWPPPLSRNTPR